MWWTCRPQVSVILTIYAMLVHGMVPACHFKRFGSRICVVVMSSEPMFNAYDLSM